MTTQEVAKRLVELCRSGQNLTALEELYSDDVISVEPNEEFQGKEVIKQKQSRFFSMVQEIHSLEISDPVIADNFFSISITMDMTMKVMGRKRMDEICVYKVENGKIVWEEFFFTPLAVEANMN